MPKDPDPGPAADLNTHATGPSGEHHPETSPGRMAWPRGPMRSIRGSHLVISTTGLMLAAWVVTTTLGFAFWFLASRTVTPHELGLASAAIAASTLIARFTMSGLGTALAGFLPGYAGRRAPLVATGLVVAVVVSAVLGLAFVVLVAAASPEYQHVAAEPRFAFLFTLTAAMTAAGVVGDQVLIGLRLGWLQLLRNVVFAASKMLMLVMAAIMSDSDAVLTILAVWALGDVLSFLVIGLVHGVSPRAAAGLEWRTVLALARNATGQNLISALRAGPALFMPILVTALLSPSANAAFYIALILTTALQVIASSATFTLFAVGDRSPSAFQRQLRVTLVLSFGIVLLGILALWVMGPWVLSLFGEPYETQAGDSILWLAACALPLVIIDHWIALRRIRARLSGAVTILFLSAVLQVVAATTGAVTLGITGLAMGWFLALTLVGLAMMPEVVWAVKTQHPDRDLVRAEQLERRAPRHPVQPDIVPAPEPTERALLSPPTIPISVFIPVRNDATWLPRAIESVLGQTYPYWELIVGDNASTEDIGEVVSRFEDPRIRYHRFDRPVPIFENWNRTASLTRTRWVQSLSADDWLAPDCLERLALAIEWYEPHVPRLVMALSSCRRVFPDGSSADHIWYGTKPRLRMRDQAYDPRSWLEVCTQDGQPPWQVGSIVMDREVLDESGGMFRPEIGLSADFEAAVRLGAYGHVAYLTDELLSYTVRDDSDGPQRLIYNRAQGVGDTVVGLALQNALHVHEEVRGLQPWERRNVTQAIARTHLQRAAQHRVLPQGRRRTGAARDVVRALRWSPRTVLSPSGVVYALGAIVAPRRLLEHARDRMTARLHSQTGPSAERVILPTLNPDSTGGLAESATAHAEAVDTGAQSLGPPRS